MYTELYFTGMKIIDQQQLKMQMGACFFSDLLGFIAQQGQLENNVFRVKIPASEPLRKDFRIGKLLHRSKQKQFLNLSKKVL
jgi:hypothetical protein